ncbi:MAG: c-type cytochrome [Comamonadaceae bacterium]|nr:MAG: c-type cytochrome [Comamonadaceae bacterium]
MSSCRSARVWVPTLVLALAPLLPAGGVQAQGKPAYPGIGRAATPQEVAAWDIDVRADFQGLPAGSGSVAKGQQVWDGKCASCHGVFGESNSVFHPLVGGTTAEDVKSGRVANLLRPEYPSRTTLMKVPTLSTLWDYINRAMPWAQPKSLSTEEVYAVTAYMLNLGGVVPDDFTLSDRNMRDVQQRMPNRNGMTTSHALWPGTAPGATVPPPRPDVQAKACMKDCAPAPSTLHTLPEHARDAHGDLAQQNRLVGAQRGADTSGPAAQAPVAAVTSAAAPSPSASADGKAAQALAQKHSCTACHAASGKLLGPSWSEIGKRHAGKGDYLAGKIRSGGSGSWGAIPMPPQSLSAEDAKSIASWLAAGAP